MGNIRPSIVILFAVSCVGARSSWAQTTAVKALAGSTVVSATGKESLSRPFAFELEVTVDNAALGFDSIVGQPLTLTAAPGLVVTGLVDGIEQTGAVGTRGTYRVRLMPRLGRLAHRISSRSFAGKSVLDIVRDVLTQAGVSNVAFRTTLAYAPRELSIQYRESDLAFVSRLLEDAGIHYHFEGGALVLADDNGGFAAGTAPSLALGTESGAAITSFQRGKSLHSGQVQAGNYLWLKPTADITSTALASQFTDLIEGDFPTGPDVIDPMTAKARATIHLQAQLAGAVECRGRAIAPLRPGYRFKLTGHPRADFNQEYVVTAVDHQVVGGSYTGSFSCLPVAQTYRPQRITPVPAIAGVVSGVVVAPPGETRHCDNYGRVRVRFPWWRPADSIKTEPGDAGWVRVLQPEGVTSNWLPDVGDEVAVAFEHGDPDRPVVIGGLYNNDRMPPLVLPANKHTWIRRVGASTSSAELVFNTVPGSESISLRLGGRSLTLDHTSAGITLGIDHATQLGYVPFRFLSIADTGITLTAPAPTPRTLKLDPSGITTSVPITQAP